jgi:microcystin-dependent protein
LIDYLYPIGSVYFSVGNTNPATRFAGTGWTQISEGRFIVGVGSDQDDNSVTKTFTEGENNGEYEHTLSIAEMPSHRHGFTGGNGNVNDQTSSPFDLTNDDPEQTWEPGSEANIGGRGILDTGGGLPHNNTPPGFGLYVWERTS